MAKKKKKAGKRKEKKKAKSKPKAKKEAPERRITLKGAGGSTIDKNTRILLYAFVILLVAFGVLFALRFFDFSKDDGTLDDKLTDPNLEETDTQYIYNGFNFVKEGGLWYTQIQKEGTNKVYTLELHYGPKDLEDIDIEGDASPFLNISGVYVLFDPTQEDLSYVALSAAELSLNLARALAITPIAACTENVTEACANRPIVDCDSTKYYTIWIKDSANTEVDVDANCLKIKGREKELVKVTERLLMKWYGIMD